MAKRKIIDFHQHLHSLVDAEKLRAIGEKFGVVKTVLLGMPESRRPGNNKLVLTAVKLNPDFFIPFAGFDFRTMTSQDILAFKDQGFWGIKFIAPLLPYNDSRYLPIYQQAARLKMVCFFHLGIVANSPAWRDCDSSLMRPIYLDHIARNFPELTIIGAHFGNPWSDEAAMACRWNPNLFFDFSGSLLKYRPAKYLSNLLWWKPNSPYHSPDNTSPWQKIVFGSDVVPEEVSDVINDYEKLFQTLRLPQKWQAFVWWKNAAKILNL
ncbi:MAG: amidohydrolase family protein [Candidatus Omnitrophica bacterium]|nr:amidohydrolase family protein [Candidatus Omnitrophota bacterium]